MIRPRIGLVAAVVFAVGAGVFGLIGALSETGDDWTVNIATELGAVALTLAVVDRIVKAQEEARVQPLVKNALMLLEFVIESVAAWVGVDYVETHVEARKQVPREVVPLLDLWIAERETGDVPRVAEDGAYPQAVESAHTHLHDLEPIRRDYRTHLEPSLVVELDAFIRSVEFAWAAANDSDDDPIALDFAMATLTHGLRELAAEYERHAGRLALHEESMSLIAGDSD